MAVNLSPVGGVAAQFFTNTGAVLTGGKLYTYAAGTTTPATTFTTSAGNTPWTNPIVLDAAGRVPSGGEIWLTDGITYKFVLKDSNDVLIATYDNISGINSNFISFTNSQQIITATAGQTVFNLSITYQPGTNSLSVFVDGVNQYGPGAQYAYTETDSDTVTFTNGLHVGAEVKFTTSQQQGAGAVNASQVSYIPAGTGAVATNVQAKLRQTVSVKDFGAVGDGTTDDTAAIQAAFNAANAMGGASIMFPTGDYAFNIDVSGVNERQEWIGQGDVICRPFLGAPTREYVVYANNSSGLGTAIGTNIIFRNLQFTGRFLGDVDPSYGRISACVYLLSSWATFYDCSFQYGINAGFYSLYGQYNEFYSCTFASCVTGSTSTGCLLDSNTAAEAANENTFFRCKFNTNKNGLVIKGGLNNRIYACQFQNTQAGGGYGALGLDDDSTGFGSDGTLISGCYFEINSGDVTIGVSANALFEGNMFLPGYITSQTCYNLSFIGNTVYGVGTIVDLNHPAGNADIAALTWIGNNFDANTDGIIHAGPSYFSINNAYVGIERNDNVLFTTNQTEANTGTDLLIGPQYGFKGNIARTVVTNIFSITQQTYASSYARYSAFEVVVNAVNDDVSSTAFGYASRLEKFNVFITNNTTGAPQVYIATLSGGSDLGINTAFAAIGAMTLTATVAGQVITFKLVYSGTGTNPTTLASINAAYTINYTGANPVIFTRL